MTTNVNTDKKQHRLLAYFRDEQIMLLATHNTETISDNMIDIVKKEIEPRLLDSGTIELLPEVLPQKFSFPKIEEGEARLNELKRLDSELRKKIQDQRQEELSKLEGELQKRENLHPLHRLLLENTGPSSAYWPEPFTSAFSLVAFNLKEAPDDPLSLLINVLKLRADLKGKEFQIETVDANGEIKIEVLRIEDISPNWAMSVASNGSGTGGPGGLPKPFQGADADAKYEFDIRQTLTFSKLYDEVGVGENVDVVILDTAPCSHTLAMAPKDWPDNKLIQGLLGKDGKLSVDSATLEDLRRMDNASLNRHDYEMSDHGFFIAGIVHSIVPKARIRLIEVLNQWGIGDFLSLATGLEKALDQIYQPGTGRRVLVNCSWMLDLPLVGDHCASIDSTDPEYDFRKAIEFEEGVLHFTLKEREQATAIWALCNSIFLAGGQVIAAAGNDWGSSRKRREMRQSLRAGESGSTRAPRGTAPEARYPASFVSAIGVGALPQESKPKGQKKHTASNYSNLGDKPERTAIMTLGGEEGEREVGKPGQSKIKNNGVLGLYLSEKYPVEINSNPAKYKYKREFEMRTRDEKKEKNSWAWWAGTSFATPIVTGTIAAALDSSTKTGAMIQEEIKKALELLYTNDIVIEDGRKPDKGTDVDEDVLQVKQGEEETSQPV